MTAFQANEPPRPLVWPEIVEDLRAAAPPGVELYLVGGVVRDALRGLPVHDIDLVTPGDGLAVARRLANELRGAYYPLDKERRTGRVVLTGLSPRIVIDVASTRGSDLLADLQSRDFTVNAIAADLRAPELIIDPLEGAQDLLIRKALRLCAPDAIRKDSIRAIRAVRFASTLKLRALPETIQAVRGAAEALRTGDALAQPERARDEFFKVLEGSKPAASLRLLDTLGLLRLLLPPGLDAAWAARKDLIFRRIERLDDLMTIISPRRDDNLAADLRLGIAVMILDRHRAELQLALETTLPSGRSMRWVAMLEALADRQADSAGAAWGDFLRLSREEMQLLDQLAAAQRQALPDTLPPAPIELYDLYQISGRATVLAVLARLAERLARLDAGLEDLPASEWSALLDQWASPVLNGILRESNRLVKPSPLINGMELQEGFGLEPGPWLGSILNRMVRAQVSGEIADKAEALQWVERLLAESAGSQPEADA